MAVTFLILFFIGVLLGSINITTTIAVGTWMNPSLFYQNLGFLKTFSLFQGFWFILLLVPSILSTSLMLFFTKNYLLRINTIKEHFSWGILFGMGATLLSTFFFLVEGVLYNQINDIETFSFLPGAFLLPLGAGFLGVFFILVFSPAIAISGCLYGLLAKKLKQKFVVV